MKKLVRDRQGRVLEFSQEKSGALVYFKLEFHQACAAYANCRIEGEVLVLADFFVAEKCVVPQPEFLKRLLGQKTLAVDFRQQGIGHQLLTTIVAYARSKGCKRIEGRLAETDFFSPDLKLPPWHQPRGFTIKEAMVFMDLAPPEDDSRYRPKP